MLLFEKQQQQQQRQEQQQDGFSRARQNRNEILCVKQFKEHTRDAIELSVAFLLLPRLTETRPERDERQSALSISAEFLGGRRGWCWCCWVAQLQSDAQLQLRRVTSHPGRHAAVTNIGRVHI